MVSSEDAPGTRPPKAEVRERLLVAAARLFSTGGVHTTTLDEVAREAGFSKGAVYSNFSSKADLVVELLRRETEGALRALDDMMLPGTFEPYGPGTAEDFALMSEFRSQALADERVMAVFVEQRRAVLEKLRGLIDQVFAGGTVPVTGLSSDTLARLLIDVALGSAFDSPATGEVSPGQVMGEVLAALTRGSST
jgi:AcrR family transcriptional regulator